jgi:hypothetical protein
MTQEEDLKVSSATQQKNKHIPVPKVEDFADPFAAIEPEVSQLNDIYAW